MKTSFPCSDPKSQWVRPQRYSVDPAAYSQEQATRLQTEYPSPATRYRLYSQLVVAKLRLLLLAVERLEVALLAVGGPEVEAGWAIADVGLDGEKIFSVPPLQWRW
jgi:hypothetical protein